MRPHRYSFRCLAVLLRPVHRLIPKHWRNRRRPLLANRNPSHHNIRRHHGHRRMDRLDNGHDTPTKTHRRNQHRKRKNHPISRQALRASDKPLYTFRAVLPAIQLLFTKAAAGTHPNHTLNRARPKNRLPL
jgi:hypothetical protein